MKIGILTQHFLRNYGGIIQNWALQQVLIRLGHDPLTFEHDTCYSRTRWVARSLKQIVLKRSLDHLPEYPYKGRVGHKPFIDFITSRIRSVTIKDFTRETERRYGCEAFVVGSDQVWRPTFNLGRLHNMYLDFASDDIKKITYAASFGVAEWEYSDDETKACQDLARRFDAISVREDSGVRQCQDKLGVQAELVLDPTLLLHSEDYKLLCRKVPESSGKVAVYALHLNNDIVVFAQQLAEKQGLRSDIYEAGERLRPTDSIEQWIAAFRDASYVVTDSFHGMAFSIIFNKPFFIFMNESGGTARYESLLQQLGLQDRIVCNDATAMPTAIDWQRVNSKRERLIGESLRFLTSSLQTT